MKEFFSLWIFFFRDKENLLLMLIFVLGVSIKKSEGDNNKTQHELIF